MSAVNCELNVVSFLSTKQTESGEVVFQYTQLSQLRNEIPPEPPKHLELEKMSKMFSVERIYNTDIITLFHASGDFRYRNRWMEGIKSVETPFVVSSFVFEVSSCYAASFVHNAFLQEIKRSTRNSKVET